jgi:hypothetical protein
MTEIAVRGEVLCEECATALSLASRTAGAGPSLSLLLPAIGAKSGAAADAQGGGGGGDDNGTLAALTSAAGLAKEEARVAALADEVRHGQAAVAVHAALVDLLEAALARRSVAASRQRAAVNA